MNTTHSLSGDWRLSSTCIPGSGPQLGFLGDVEPTHVPARFRVWQYAAVPGCVQQTLLETGELPDPFFADNIDHWRWVEDREWWYRRTFSVPAGFPLNRVRLSFDRLDTIATVYLNGERIGSHSNFFRPLDIDVTGRLRVDKENVLAVRLEPPHWASNLKSGDGTSGFTDPHRVHTRKPQFSFGWDIAPRLMTVGVPGDVRLVAVDDIEIKSAYVRTVSLDSKGADIQLVVALRNHLGATVEAMIDATVASQTIRASKPVPAGDSEHILPVRLDGIKRWEPRGVGEPALHSCALNVRCGDAVDRREFQFGVRTVELIQRPQPDGGASFIISVNGTELFIKGLNYTPGDSLLTRIDDTRTETLFNRAYDCNVNLLRVWGGGYYETDFFYDLCDRRGILVWQDFMLGCGQYPQDDGFVKEVAAEADWQLSRLRRHPSLAFLAGDNENDCFHFYAGSSAFYQCRLTRGAIADAARRLCPELPYIPSSPVSPVSPDPLSPMEGDNHLWNHLAPHNHPPFLDDNSRFMSEMGRLSLPPLEVIRQFIPAGQELPLTSPLWKFHAADTERVGFGDRMQFIIDCLTDGGHRIPETIEGLIELSQRVQCEALIYWAKTYYSSPVCAGVIFWNLCDCWPQMSDAIIAYPDIPKPAYAALRDIFGRMDSVLANRKPL